MFKTKNFLIDLYINNRNLMKNSSKKGNLYFCREYSNRVIEQILRNDYNFVIDNSFYISPSPITPHSPSHTTSSTSTSHTTPSLTTPPTKLTTSPHHHHTIATPSPSKNFSPQSPTTPPTKLTTSPPSPVSSTLSLSPSITTSPRTPLTPITPLSSLSPLSSKYDSSEDESLKKQYQHQHLNPCPSSSAASRYSFKKRTAAILEKEMLVLLKF
ncbi:hypothetical protein ACTA71_000818 [Dictyostelium dimigraforme]